MCSPVVRHEGSALVFHHGFDPIGVFKLSLSDLMKMLLFKTFLSQMCRLSITKTACVEDKVWQILLCVRSLMRTRTGIGKLEQRVTEGIKKGLMDGPLSLMAFPRHFSSQSIGIMLPLDRQGLHNRLPSNTKCQCDARMLMPKR